ncbi:hypothetical protein HDU97_006062 [Phlyctochytrium planicorne]|nr:hypothetical protein HDU97_006062 [Phlyctochytrium planicorne]
MDAANGGWNPLLGGGVGEGIKESNAGGFAKVMACDHCYRLHRKCDGGIPKCSLCRRVGGECVYSRKKVVVVKDAEGAGKRKGKGRGARALKKRVLELEGTVQSLLGEISQMRTSVGRHVPVVVPYSGVALVGDAAMPVLPPLPFVTVPSSSGAGGAAVVEESPCVVPSQRFLEVGAGDGFGNGRGATHFAPVVVDVGGGEAGFSEFGGVGSMAYPPPPPPVPCRAGELVGDPNVDVVLGNAFDASLTFGDVVAVQESGLRNPLMPFLGRGVGVSRILLTAWSMKMLGFTGVRPKVGDLEREGLVNDFFEYMQRFPLPIVHEHYIRERLRNNISPNPSLLYAIYAVAGCLSPSADGSKWPFQGMQNQRSKQFCGAALSLLDLENPTLESCQAIALVAVYLFLIGNHRRESQYSGMAVRMMSILRLDVDPDLLEVNDPSRRKWSWLEKETRRRIFAGFCAFDALDALYNENSSGMWPLKGQVKDFSTFEVWQSIDVRTGEPTINPECVPKADASVHMLSMLNILAKTNDLCSSTGANIDGTFPHTSTSVHGDPGLEERFHALDLELKAWVDGLPREMTLSALQNETMFACQLPIDARSRQVPFFGALRIHLYHYAAVLMLHRTRLFREFARMARSMENSEDGRLPELFPAGRESLRRCVEACSNMIKLLRREVVMVSPSPLPSDRTHPVAAFCTPIEARAILECGLHSIVVIALMEGPGLKSPTLPNGMLDWNGVKQRRQVVDAKITSLIEEYGGPDALADARYTLGVSAGLLEQLACRKPNVRVLSEMLGRLISQAGIGGLERVDVLGCGQAGNAPFVFEGVMM